MDASHQTLLRLYDEPLPVGVPPQPPDEADRLALMEAKAWMDARAPRAASPDAFALDAIFRAAAHGSADGEVHIGARHDRAPLRRPNRFQRAWTFVGAAGAVAALGFAAVTVVLRPATSGTPVTSAARVTHETSAAVPAAAPTADAPPSASLAAAPVAPPMPPASMPVGSKATAKAAPAPVAIAAAPARPAAPKAPAAGTLFRADDDAALAAARTRAASLRARLDSAAWDAPAVAPSLGTGATRRFTQASHQ